MATITIDTIKVKRGTDIKVQSYVPGDGELLFNLDTFEMSVGDGITTGGVKVAMASEDANDIATQLALKLDKDAGNMTATQIVEFRAAMSLLSSGEIDSRLATKLSISNIVNNVTNTSATKALSAAQGKVLQDQINAINTLLASDDTTLDSMQEIVDFIQQNKADLEALNIASINGLQSALDGKASVNHSHTESDISDLDKYTQSEVDAMVANKVTKNSTITGATKCKITYDSKGLVTGGSNLSSSDIPSLAASKITSGQFLSSRIPGLDASKITSGEIAIDRLPDFECDGGVLS